MSYCPLCGDEQLPNDEDSWITWRHKHDQKNHPRYWEAQTGKKPGEEE